MRRARKIDAAKVLAAREVVVIDGVLSAAACKRMVEDSRRGLWLPSTVAYGSKSPLDQMGNGRNSCTLCNQPHSGVMARCIRAVEETLERTLGIKPNRLEPWQVTRYVTGQGFDFHVDCGHWRRHPSGERRRSVLLYLKAPERGGHTFFRALNLRILPVAGRLVVWNNLLPNGGCNHAMVHAGLPVSRGSKVILTTWERERPFV